LLLMKGYERGNAAYFFLAGLSGSASFLVRPFDQCVVLVPVGIYLLYSLMRKYVGMRAIALFAAGQLHGFVLFLVYNALQNGHPLTTGYHVSDSWMDKWFDLSLPMWSYNMSYLSDLLTWSPPVLPILAVFALFTASPKSVRSWERCFAAILFALVVAFSPIAFHEGPSYGPRYYYSGFLAIPLLGAAGLMRLSQWIPKRLVIPLFIGTAVVGLGIAFRYYGNLSSQMICAMDDFKHHVERISPGRALVFLARDPRSGQAQTRNSIDFNGNIVYAVDLGEEKNSRLMRAYPGRRYFVYRRDGAAGQPTLREITENE
jgi:hypothetical protein